MTVWTGWSPSQCTLACIDSEWIKRTLISFSLSLTLWPLLHLDTHFMSRLLPTASSMSCMLISVMIKEEPLSLSHFSQFKVSLEYHECIDGLTQRQCSHRNEFTMLTTLHAAHIAMSMTNILLAQTLTMTIMSNNHKENGWRVTGSWLLINMLLLVMIGTVCSVEPTTGTSSLCMIFLKFQPASTTTKIMS